MDDNGKHLRLFGTIFLTLVGFIAALVLLFLGMRLLFGLLTYMPWLSYVYMLIMLSVPAAIFISVYLVYFKRTKTHPVKAVRWISQTIFIVSILVWIAAYISDLVLFFKKGSEEIGHYWSYNMIFLAIDVALIFIIGVIQAFT